MTVTCERAGPLAVITLGGEGEPTLDAGSIDALRRVTLGLTDAPPRAVVVTGGAQRFCSGLQLSLGNPTFQRLEGLARNRDAFAIQETISGVRSILTGLGRVPCPVIAAIEGPCLGAGFELALSCDVRIAASEATFGFPAVRMGLMPMNGGLVQISRLLGRARATHIALSGRTLSAAELDALGLLSEVCPPGQALVRGRALAERLLQMSPSAVLQTVLALRRLDGSSEAYDIETQSAARAISSGELFEALRAGN